MLWKPTNPADAGTNTDDTDDGPAGRPRLVARAYAVFAAEQCDGADEIIARRNQQRTERDTPARTDAAERYLTAVAGPSSKAATAPTTGPPPTRSTSRPSPRSAS